MAGGGQTREGKEIVRALLEKHDYDENGRIDADELLGCLSEVGIFCTREDAEYLKKCFDTDGNGKLEIEELMSNWDTIMKHSVLGEDLLEAFRSFDYDGNGTIRLPELLKILTTMGKDPMTGEEASKVLEGLMKYDENRDGKFSYAEFVDIMLGEDYPFKKPKIEKKSIMEQEPSYS